MPRSRIALVVGTRPEVIKTAPVVRALRRCADTEPVLISTGQHRDLLHGALEAFDLEPDHHLGVMTPKQTPDDVVARILASLPRLFRSLHPEVVLVQGDTSSTFAAALAAFHHHIPVGHIEAGLRTRDLEAPFPEEAYRQMTDRISTWCFAPTPGAAEHLRCERIPAERIHVTGNTVVDALLDVLSSEPPVEPENPFVLMTLHRRESFGEPMREVLLGVRDFLELRPDARILWPMHPNPRIEEATEALRGLDRLDRIPPLAFKQFVGRLAACRLVLTDSGGIQEEAPSLGKRVLIARETTERPEAVDSGWNQLVGRTRQSISEALVQGWEAEPYRGPLPAPSPYGDGKAAQRIVEILAGEPDATSRRLGDPVRATPEE